MAEWSANDVQTVAPGESIVFTSNPVPPRSSLVRHRDESGNFLMRGYGSCPRGSSIYRVIFNGNIAVPTGGTVGAISIASQIASDTVPSTTAIATPAAVEEFFHVGIGFDAQIWNGCCESFSVVNTSDQSILVQNANLIIE